jgi:phosphoribosylformimino-5-aminoimidazole carboxamide ribotide isomerase
MIAIPAIDIREGACVQLVGGSYGDERVRIADPLEALQRWSAAGFRHLHVVDLDAATGAGANSATIDRLVNAWAGEVSVGGGVRTLERVRELLAAGASRVVVGTRAIADRDWLEAIVTEYPGRIVVAADVRRETIVTHGWTRDGSIDVLDFTRSLGGLAIAGVLVTAVLREGRLLGTDADLMKRITEQAEAPVIASGGIASVEELRALAADGIGAAVLGMSLYTGVLDARAVATEFAE